jgi:Tripartite tricarboxylate transporter TctB family
VFGLARALGADRAAADPASTPAEVRHERLTNMRRLATIVCLGAFVATLPLFGFAVTTPLLLFVLFYVFGRTSLAQNLVLAFVGGLALWVLFVGILKLPLRGTLWDPLTPFLSNFLRSMGL